MFWKTSLQPVLKCCPVLDVSASTLHLHIASALGTNGYRLKFQGESNREQEWGETTVVYVALNMHAGVYLWVHARWSICVGVHSIVVGDYNTKNPNSQIKSRSM